MCGDELTNQLLWPAVAEGLVFADWIRVRLVRYLTFV